MRITSKAFVICTLTFLLNLGSKCASLELYNDTGGYFTVFIGAKLTLENGDITKEIVGLGVVIGNKQVLSTEEYLKWYGEPNITYYILCGTNNFDVGGQQVQISEKIKIPQNNVSGTHTFVLLKFKRDLMALGQVRKILYDDKFIIAGYKVSMIGVYEREFVQLGVTYEMALANIECTTLLQTNENDRRYKQRSSHMCLKTSNWNRVDCKSHIASVLFYKVGPIFFLVGIKSQMHQPCSKIPYVIEFLRLGPIAASLD